MFLILLSMQTKEFYNFWIKVSKKHSVMPIPNDLRSNISDCLRIFQRIFVLSYLMLGFVVESIKKLLESNDSKQLTKR